MAWFAQKWRNSAVLVPIGIASLVVGALFGLTGNAPITVAFVGAGVLFILAGAFFTRMYGPTKLGNQITTNLAPDVAFQARIEQAPQPLLPQLDASILVARWPTLASALGDIPADWTQTRIRHDDGQDYLHVKTPQGGFDLVVNTAALDSAAPRWLMVAISVMETGP